jgi:hypothetical protein
VQSEPTVKICEDSRVLHTLLTYGTPEGERRCGCLFESIEEVEGTSKAVKNTFLGETTARKDVSSNFKLQTEAIDPFDDFDGNVEGAVGGVAADRTKNEDGVFTPNEEVKTQVINQVIKCNVDVRVCLTCADVSEKCSPFFVGKTFGFVCRHFSPVNSEALCNGEEIFVPFW